MFVDCSFDFLDHFLVVALCTWHLPRCFLFFCFLPLALNTWCWLICWFRIQSALHVWFNPIHCLVSLMFTSGLIWFQVSNSEGGKIYLSNIFYCIIILFRGLKVVIIFFSFVYVLHCFHLKLNNDVFWQQDCH